MRTLFTFLEKCIAKKNNFYISFFGNVLQLCYTQTLGVLQPLSITLDLFRPWSFMGPIEFVVAGIYTMKNLQRQRLYWKKTHLWGFFIEVFLKVQSFLF